MLQIWWSRKMKIKTAYYHIRHLTQNTNCHAIRTMVLIGTIWRKKRKVATMFEGSIYNGRAWRTEDWMKWLIIELAAANVFPHKVKFPFRYWWRLRTLLNEPKPSKSTKIHKAYLLWLRSHLTRTTLNNTTPLLKGQMTYGRLGLQIWTALCRSSGRYPLTNK